MSQSIFPPGGIDFSKTQLQSYRYPPRSCLVAKVSEFQECATYCIPPLSRSPPFSMPDNVVTKPTARTQAAGLGALVTALRQLRNMFRVHSLTALK